MLTRLDPCLSASLLLSVALAGCARDGAITVAPPAGTECVELVAYPADVACPPAGSTELPSDAPLRTVMACDGAAFPGTDLPDVPLTLIAVARDGCAVLGMACAAARPGEDTALEPELSVTCPPECTEGRCAEASNACCVAEASDDCDGDGFTNEEEGLSDRANSDDDPIWDACDPDSDNDGLPDAEECRGDCLANCEVVNGEPRVTRDTDDDGIEDGLECCGLGGSACDPDGDGCSADVDLDSDDDTVPDAREVLFSNDASCDDLDCDGDGVCSPLDLDSDGDGAYDRRECPTPTEACDEAYDSDEFLCGTDPVSDVCGRCGLRQVCTDLPCRRNELREYCAPELRLAIQLGGDPVDPSMSLGNTAHVRFVPMHGRVPEEAEPIEFSFAYAPGFRATWSTPVGLFERFLASGQLACDAPTVFEDPACHGVFRVDVQDEDTGTCGTSVGVIAVSTAAIDLPAPSTLGDVPFYEMVFSPDQRAALVRLERGWQVLTPGSGTAWDRSTLGGIPVPELTAGCPDSVFPVFPPE